tara:strand:- start:1217 stop:1396 length:180 start_codon:yes stop_codon:yes gene_type:complete
MKSKTKMASYGYGGGFKATKMSPAKERMSMMAKGGGLMGYMNGGDVLEGYKKGGSCCGK